MQIYAMNFSLILINLILSYNSDSEYLLVWEKNMNVLMNYRVEMIMR